MPLKVLVVSTPIFKLCGPNGTLGYSGLEALAWQTAKGLAEKGHKVSIVAPDGSECPGVDVIAIGPEGKVNEKDSYSHYWKELNKFDVIIEESWSKQCYTAKAEGWLKAPVLGVLHAPPMTMFQTIPRFKFGEVRKPCFICISNDQSYTATAHFRCAVRVAYNGCDPNFYRYIGCPRSDRYLFLARFSSIKGPSIAIDACLEAGVGLDLVGNTSITNEPQLLEVCYRLAEQSSPGWDRSKGKQIRIIGPASRSECVWWYSQAKALLHPNKLFQEPFGLAPVESQLCLCPVIAWNNGAMRETIDIGRSGFLVESEEELVKLLKNNVVELLDRNYCREWASRFSVDRMIDRYEELCTEAIEQEW